MLLCRKRFVVGDDSATRGFLSQTLGGRPLRYRKKAAPILIWNILSRRGTAFSYISCTKMVGKAEIERRITWKKVLYSHFQNCPPTSKLILAPLTRAKVFSKLDANSGFWQIPLSKESFLLTTFIKPLGRFCYYRLRFGISGARAFLKENVTDPRQPGWSALSDGRCAHFRCHTCRAWQTASCSPNATSGCRRHT